nr:MAG TPA: hypothetical protein [Caudoviricetes sp.]
MYSSVSLTYEATTIFLHNSLLYYSRGRKIPVEYIIISDS